MTATSGSMEALIASQGRVDALVLNAGWTRAARFLDTTEEDWWNATRVNFLGAVLVAKMCLPGMLDSGGGSIVCTTSEAAKVGDAGHAPYSATKAALMSWCKTIVHEFGRHGIRANAVAPGPIDTTMLRYSYSSPEEAEVAIAKLTRLVPTGRLGHSDEVAAAVCFLLSDATFVAGQHLSVGGGVSMYS